MKLKNGQIVPALEATSALLGEDKIGFEAADQIADVVIALEDRRRKLALVEKNILGGRERVTAEDEDFEEVVANLTSFMEEEVDLDVKPLTKSLLSKANVTVSSLAVLKMVGLID